MQIHFIKNNNMKYTITIMLLISTYASLYAQESAQGTISIKSNVVSAGLLGAPHFPVGLSYEHMFSKRVSLEAGAGIFAAGLGVKYYITDITKRRFNYYTGPYFMVYWDNPSMMYYLPFGITYISRRNLQLGFDAGIMISEAVDPNPSPWIGAKIGYRFGKPFSPEGVYPGESSEPADKNYISISLGSTTPVIGITYERILAGFLGIEAGAGLFSGGAGIKLYPFKLKKEDVSFHLGASHYIFAFPMIGADWKTYVPLGFDYISSNHIRYSIDAGPVFSWDNDYSSNELMPGINFRVGKAF